MDDLFEDWKKTLDNFKSSVEKDLDEIRKQKAAVQQMKAEIVSELNAGRYLRDEQRLVLSAPEIVIGNVDKSGVLLDDGGSIVIVRSNQIKEEAAGPAGRILTRAASIRHIAVDPGMDGQEAVVGSLSEVVSQARSITLQSNNAEEMFTEPPVSTGCSGVRIHADERLDIEASVSSENKEKRLKALLSELKDRNTDLEKQMMKHKLSFSQMVASMEKLLLEKRGDIRKYLV